MITCILVAFKKMENRIPFLLIVKLIYKQNSAVSVIIIGHLQLLNHLTQGKAYFINEITRRMTWMLRLISILLIELYNAFVYTLTNT